MGDIYLEPEEEIIKNAKDIAEASKSAEKYIFRILYEADEKSVVLSEVKRLECEILEHSDAKSFVTIRASMEQLAAIKSLNCVIRVETEDAFIAETAEMPTENSDSNITESTVFTEQISLSTMEDESVSAMCYGGDSGSDCDNSNTMQSAYYLPLSSWVNGCICCPGTEIWYRFTASASNAAEYTIYTSGSLDTMGYLYNSNGALIASNDDGGGNLNFSITEQLTYGATYYVKVKAYGSNIGAYSVRVNYTTQSSSGGSGDSDCSNDQASAIQLTLNSWRSDEICCPGAEMWYKFTPSTTAYYTVYTAGSLDTVGRIYDANSNQLGSDDDTGTGLNFRMVVHLTAGQTYYVKVSAYGSNTGYFSIAVTSTVFVEYVSIDQSHIALDKGKTKTLTTTVSPFYATNKTLRWETGNAAVATVSQSGVVTARGAGSTCICAYSQDGTNKSSCCEVSVNVPVESVTINTSSLLMRVGEYDYLYAEVCPTDAVNKLIRWSSSNTGVVWVNEATGRVEARGIGSATVYATAQDGTGVKGSCSIRVDAPISVEGIDICCDNYTMNVGETKYLSYDIYPADATNKSVVWCSSNPNVASVDASTGRITANLAGITTISATTNDGSYVDSCNVSVNQILTYPDTLITHDETRQKIIKLKTLMDENQKAYLEGKISACTKDLIEQQLSTECDVARADYIVVGDNPTSNYAYAILGGDTNATVPFSFKNNLTLNSTGIAVIVVQRALEIMGYYEPKDSENYGVFDTNTYDSACSYPVLMSYDNQMQKYIFDNASFNVLFQTSTRDERTFNAFTELNKFKTVHNIVAQWSAEKVGGTYKMSDNIINNGNSAGNYYGYADVLKDTGACTYIWEVKPDKERYYRVGGIGDRQLQRYLYAGNAYEQRFTKPLTIGYHIGNFSIPFLFNKYINVRNFNNPTVATDARNGLILYKVEDTSEFSIETVPVAVEQPSESYDYEYSYSFNTSTWGPVIVVGTALVLDVVCIALAGPSGGTSLVPLTLLAA